MWLKKYTKDIILLGSLAIFVGLSFLILFFVKQGLNTGGKRYVRIEKEERIMEILPLFEDTEKEYLFFLSNHEAQFRNTVKIKDGWVEVISADCPEQICVHTGKKQEVGDSIVCLPHRFVVTVISEKEAEDLKKEMTEAVP